MNFHIKRRSIGSCQLNPQCDPISDLFRKMVVQPLLHPRELSHTLPTSPSFVTFVRVTPAANRLSDQTSAEALRGFALGGFPGLLAELLGLPSVGARLPGHVSSWSEFCDHILVVSNPPRWENLHRSGRQTL